MSRVKSSCCMVYTTHTYTVHMTKHLHILLSNTSHWGSQGYTTTAFNYFVLYFYFLFIYFCWKWKKTHHWYADILHQKDSISPVSHRPCPFCKKGVASQHVRILYVTEWQSYQGHLLTLTAVEVSHARNLYKNVQFADFRQSKTYTIN